MSYNKFIFDVGANDGTDGLALALKNKNYFIHAFEANPFLCSEIKKLKIKLENRKGIKIKNYKIHNYAVSNKEGLMNFNISINHKVSSLNNLSSNIDQSWPGYKENIFKVSKTIKVKTITLKNFMKKNKVTHINHLHTDTQGHDLHVLKGLKNEINKVYQGQMEASISRKNSAYKNASTIKDIKKFLKKTNLKIIKIVNIDHLSDYGILNNEADVFYVNKKKVNADKLNLKYKRRYFNRLINNNTYLKDDIFDYISKFVNKFLN